MKIVDLEWNATFTSEAARYIVGAKWIDMSNSAQNRAKDLLIDLLGCQIAGSQLSASEIARKWVGIQYPGSEAGIWPGTQRATLVGAVFANSLAANALDLDDGYRPVKGHPGACVIPTALATAESMNATGVDLLTAVIVGYEVGLRAGRVLHASYNDYHCSGSWGAIAAAATASHLLRLDEQSTDTALGIAEYYAPTGLMMRCIKDPSMIKDGIPWGAMTGVSSTFLAQAGLTGSPHLLHPSAELGYKGETEKSVLPTLGEGYLIEDVYIKPHACCRWAQPAVEGILAVREEAMKQSTDVIEILVETFHEATTIHVKHPKTTEEAQYSLPWAVASAFLYGKVGADEVGNSALHVQMTNNMADCVQMISVTEFDAEFPQKTKARVKLKFQDGTSIVSGIYEPRGEPHVRPFTTEDIRSKFIELTSPVMGDVRSAELLVTLETIESLGELSPLWGMLSEISRK